MHFESMSMILGPGLMDAAGFIGPRLLPFVCVFLLIHLFHNPVKEWLVEQQVVPEKDTKFGRLILRSGRRLRNIDSCRSNLRERKNDWLGTSDCPSLDTSASKKYAERLTGFREGRVMSTVHRIFLCETELSICRNISQR